MSAIRTIYARVFAVSVATFLAAWPSEVGAQQLRIGPSDIGGVVTSANGPEAGVWVIAETTGLGTRRYAKIVVTDEQGRYLLPALPSGAPYNVWVRGFGLVDSRRVPAQPGMRLHVSATRAPTARAAGRLAEQNHDWRQRMERNTVFTHGDWSRPTAYLRDLIGTDKRKPTVNGWGALYGSMELSTDWVPILDPVLHMTTEMKMPVKDASTPRSSTVNIAPAPWHYWGDRVIWDTQVNAHTNTMDSEGRVWWTATSRPQWEQPEFCQKGSDHPSAKAFPRERASGPATNTTNFVQNARGVTMYDPKTKQWAFVDTCFGTHHLNFGYDADNTLYLANNGGPELGWVNTRVFLETGDSAKAQGWTPFIVDTNGNGKRDDYVEPDAPVDPRKDKRFNLGFYGIAVNPNDGTVWGSNTSGRGWIVRVDLGPNPPVTALTEAYQLPPTELGIRGMDLDSKGIAWAAGVGGNLISFDRSKCRVRNGPTATGDHCPEGFTLHPIPGPKFDGVEGPLGTVASPRSEEHTSELQSPVHLVCRLLLEKKKSV